VLGVELADAGVEELVVAAPEEEGVAPGQVGTRAIMSMGAGWLGIIVESLGWGDFYLAYALANAYSSVTSSMQADS
jgi:hypothetical protein